MKTSNKISKNLLKSIPSPGGHTHEVRTEEFTVMGDYDQPDLGTLVIYMVPNKLCIELKSLKKYLYQFRNKRMSYERAVETIFHDLNDFYNPDELIIRITFKVRGGLSSTIVKGQSH